MSTSGPGSEYDDGEELGHDDGSNTKSYILPTPTQLAANVQTKYPVSCVYI